MLTNVLNLKLVLLGGKTMLFKVTQPDHEWGDPKDGSIRNCYFPDVLVVKADSKEECMGKVKKFFDKEIQKTVESTNRFRKSIDKPTIDPEKEPYWFDWPTFEVSVLEGDLFEVCPGDHAESMGDIKEVKW